MFDIDALWVPFPPSPLLPLREQLHHTRLQYGGRQTARLIPRELGLQGNRHVRIGVELCTELGDRRNGLWVRPHPGNLLIILVCTGSRPRHLPKERLEGIVPAYGDGQAGVMPRKCVA